MVRNSGSVDGLWQAHVSWDVLMSTDGLSRLDRDKFWSQRGVMEEAARQEEISLGSRPSS